MIGLDKAKKIIDENIHKRPVLLYGDPDVDGLISLLFLTQLCEMKGVKYSYYVNNHRFHGFTQDPLALSGYLVISADFAITQEFMQSLVDNDVMIASFDHHEVQSELINVKSSTGAEGIVINNQYPFEPEENQYNSGAGVVYEAFCEMYPEFKSDEREALVGLTLLSDVRPIENNANARKYLKKLYTSDTTKGYIGYLVSSTKDNDYGFGVPKLDRNYVDFTLSPRINSMLRFDRTSEAIDFIFGKGIQSENFKDKQKSFVDVMLMRGKYLRLNNIHIIAFDAHDFTDYRDADITNFIGLCCSRHKDNNGNVSTLAFSMENGRVTRASFRGKYSDIPYRHSFKQIGIDAQGHNSAFGIQSFNPTVETWQSLDDVISDLEYMHKPTETIIEIPNLSSFALQKGLRVAQENCYVRDIYRTYIKYTGVNAKIVRETYKYEPFSDEDYMNGKKPDKVVKNEYYKYVLDVYGNPVPSYIEYLIDGKTVKSFGVNVYEGIILPIMDKGYIAFYVRSNVN